MNTRLPIILALFVFLVGTQPSLASGGEARDVDILRALLKYLVAEQGAFALMLDSTTVPSLLHLENAEGGLTFDRDQQVDISPELWKALRKENRVPSTLESVPGVGGVLLVAASDLPLVGSTDESWMTFRSRWPELNAIVRVSRPVVTADCREALIFITVTRGPLDAEGILFSLQRDEGSWAITMRQTVIAS